MDDTVHNQIAEKLRLAFFEYFRYYPGPAEVNSWRNSLRAVSMVFQSAGLTDHGVLLEYQLPLTSLRLDCMICGKDAEKADNAVIIELKQWDECEDASGEMRFWCGWAVLKGRFYTPQFKSGSIELILRTRTQHSMKVNTQ